ncbi:WYL domain-containing protein [Okibacterium endophyticum]
MADDDQLKGSDKLALLLSLVPYLMEHEQVTVSDAAAHFGLDPQLIRDAVRLIAVSGVPGETDAYQPDDLFDIDWDLFLEHDEIVLTNLVVIDDSPRFSSREAAALIAGLQYLSALPEQANGQVVGSLLSKLAIGASSRPSEVAVGIRASHTDLSTIREAVAAAHQVEFDYVSARDEREHRTVDPLRIESLDDDWYLRGWCHTRGAVRTFRLDRMTAVRKTDRPISDHAHEVMLPETLFEPSDSHLRVEVELDEASLPLIAEYVTRTSRPSKGSGRVRATLSVAHHHGLKRLVAGLPGIITVVSPDSAIEVVSDWAHTALDRYGVGGPRSEEGP